MDRVIYVLMTGEIELVRVMGVIVLIGVLVSALLLLWVDDEQEEGEEE